MGLDPLPISGMDTSELSFLGGDSITAPSLYDVPPPQGAYDIGDTQSVDSILNSAGLGSYTQPYLVPSGTGVTSTPVIAPLSDFTGVPAAGLIHVTSTAVPNSTGATPIWPLLLVAALGFLLLRRR